MSSLSWTPHVQLRLGHLIGQVGPRRQSSHWIDRYSDLWREELQDDGVKQHSCGLRNRRYL